MSSPVDVEWSRKRLIWTPTPLLSSALGGSPLLAPVIEPLSRPRLHPGNCFEVRGRPWVSKAWRRRARWASRIVQRHSVARYGWPTAAPPPR